MKANFRQVFVYNLDVGTRKANAVLPTLAALVAIWDRRRQNGQSHVPVSNGDIDLTLGDVVIDAARRRATLLVRHSDKYAAESVYSNIAANTYVAHPKAQNEGGETGAHVFLSLAPERGTPNRYTCLIEKVPYLDSNMIRRFLNRIIRDEYDADPTFFSYPSPIGQRNRAGAVVTERCQPRIDLEGRPSPNLANDVQNGRLNGITLIRTERKTTVGGVAFLKKSEATLKLEVDHGGLPANVWGGVRRALRAEAATYPAAQINLRLPGRDKTVSVKVDSQNGAPLSDLYVRSHDITNITPPLANSAQAVVGHFVRRVTPLLDQERNI